MTTLAVAPNAGIPDLVVIPCGGRKRAGIWKARALYTGPYFSAALAYALAVTPNANYVRILSAKHGLVELDFLLEAYDLYMGAPGCVTVAQLILQAQQHDLGHLRDVRVIGGAEYIERAAGVWPKARRVLPEGLPMGEQISALKRLRLAWQP